MRSVGGPCLAGGLGKIAPLFLPSLGGPVVHPPDNMSSMEHPWNDIDMEIPKDSEKNLSQCNLFYFKTS
jgi:hypothetical protein